MRTKVIQTNFTGGEISPTLAGRIDLDKYYKSCASAENVIIMPHGGLKRRDGLRKCADGYINKYSRFEAFTFSTSQSYLISVSTDYIDIYKDGEHMASVVSPFTTVAMVDEFDTVQSADTMIFVHQDLAPRKLVRSGSDTSWTISTITLTNIPKYNYGSGDENVWSSSRGWPRTVTFHGGRLWFGGSKSKISSVWGSKSNDFFNFDMGTGLDDEGIFDTLDTDQYNQIEGIFSGRNLQVFTTGGEFYNKTAVITPSDSVWSMQTAYGSVRIRPVMIDGSTLFISRNRKSLRQFIYNFTEDAYVSINALLMSEHLASNGIKTIDVQRATLDNISDLVYVIDNSGVCLVLNVMRTEDILGWTKWTTDGQFIDVAVVGDSAYFLVKRGDNYYIEILTSGTYTDHNTTGTGTNITGIDTNEEGYTLTRPHKVVLDDAVQADITPDAGGVITFARSCSKFEVGLGYSVNIETMPITFNGPDGQQINSRKRVLKTTLRIYNTRGAYVQGKLLRDRKFPIVLNQTEDPYTGALLITHLGYNRINTVTVTQDDPLPFHLLQIESETEA